MAYNLELADRVRAALGRQPGINEKKMFGGLAYMINGNMCCGIMGDELMVRVGPIRYDTALTQPHVRPIDFIGRPMRGMVLVASAGVADDNDLTQWIGEGVAFAEGLPPK